MSENLSTTHFIHLPSTMSFPLVYYKKCSFTFLGKEITKPKVEPQFKSTKVSTDVFGILISDRQAERLSVLCT